MIQKEQHREYQLTLSLLTFLSVPAKKKATFPLSRMRALENSVATRKSLLKRSALGWHHPKPWQSFKTQL
jgi:hypothetical protein